VTNFESLKKLFEFLKFSLMPQKTLDRFKWVGYGKSHAQRDYKTNQNGFVAKQIYLFINYDEATTMG
jgi:hypothetical protein